MQVLSSCFLLPSFYTPLSLSLPQFVILPKISNVLLLLGRVRAVMFCDRVLVFDVEGKDSPALISALQAAAVKWWADSSQGDTSPTEAGAPFECTVLDTCLEQAHEKYHSRIFYTRPLINKLLRRLNVVDPAEFNTRLVQLFPMRGTLQHFVTVTKNLMDELEEMLANERLLREACLTDKDTWRKSRQQVTGEGPAAGDGSPRSGAPGRFNIGAGRAGRGVSGTSVGSGAAVQVTEDSLVALETMLESWHRQVSESHQAARELVR
jgi:hypothetical protein